ncbi:hypothetical protein VIGAN_02213000, partial [Vigna angularis var. angularis]
MFGIDSTRRLSKWMEKGKEVSGTQSLKLKTSLILEKKCRRLVKFQVLIIMILQVLHTKSSYSKRKKICKMQHD